jgi:hypothetical protein
MQNIFKLQDGVVLEYCTTLSYSNPTNLNTERNEQHAEDPKDLFWGNPNFKRKQ